MAFDVFTMPNGLRVVGEQLPNARSVAIGMYIGVGSQFEPEKLNGISHFMEHMVFKGTQTRSARRIAIEMDRIGGQINAYTAKECTCFYTRTLPRYLREAMEVVCDLVMDPAFDPEEMEKEKGVVLEEIAMANDDPEDLTLERLMTAHFGKQSIARPILGTERKVEGFTREDLIAFHGARYCPKNAVFSIAGKYEPEEVKTLLAELTGEWKNSDAQLKAIPATKAPIFSGVSRNRAIEQTHICLGYPGVPIDDPINYELSIVSTVYGGAMSSRLFQRIREELGLAYSVYSEMGDYVDCGILTVYAAVNPDRTRKVYNAILELTEEFARTGMTQEEFDMARDQLSAEIILGGESVSSRMQSNGRRMLLMNTTRSEEDILERLNAIEFESVNRLLRQTLTSPHSLSIVGRNAAEMLKTLRN